MTERYFEINRDGHNIRCKQYYEKGRDVKDIIVLCHGFAGHKDNATAKKFSERVIGKHPFVSVICFDWPCHGTDVKKKLTIEDCFLYLRFVSEYIRDMYPLAHLFVRATSFGAYVVLAYLKRFGNPFEKIVLRSPAINMYDSITTSIIPREALERIQKGKTVAVGFDRTVDIDLAFLSSLSEEDIRKTDYFDYADDILIIHGTEDEIIPFAVSKSFAENNVIELLSVNGADHRFQNPLHLEIATKATLEFFGL